MSFWNHKLFPYVEHILFFLANSHIMLPSWLLKTVGIYLALFRESLCSFQNIINEKEFVASIAKSFSHVETLPYLNLVPALCILHIIILAQPSGVQ